MKKTNIQEYKMAITASKLAWSSSVAFDLSKYMS